MAGERMLRGDAACDEIRRQAAARGMAVGIDRHQKYQHGNVLEVWTATGVVGQHKWALRTPVSATAIGYLLDQLARAARYDHAEAPASAPALPTPA